MQTANRIFYLLIGITAVVLLLFRLIGYDIPYDENPDYNAPLLTGTLINYILLLMAAAFIAAIASGIRSMRMNRRENRIVNNIPAHRIAVATVAGTALLMAMTFALSSTSPLTINGTEYSNSFWLRTAGMFILSSIIMIAVAIAAVIYGATRNRR